MTKADLHYELSQHRLDNGLQVVVAPDDAAPGVAVNIWVEVGSADEVPGRTGFAHLFEHLMFQGSGNVASGEHMATVEALGGTVNATTSSDRTNYFETVPPGALDLALWMEADRFASLAITPENFEAQRQVVKEEKRQRYDNQPYGDLLELLVAQHFDPSHPYGHLTIGSMEDLDASSLDDVASFFAAWYPASNLRLVLCGPVSADEGLTLAEKHFGDLPTLAKPHRREMPAHGHRSPESLTVSRQVPHSLSYLSWATPPAAHPDIPALDMALAVLSDGHASRLHRSLVKQSDVAYEVHSGMLTNRSADSITTVISRPADGVSLEQVSDAVLEGINQLIEDGPGEAELDRAVAQFERDWLWELATTSGRADAINEAWLVHGDPQRVNTSLAEVLALTPEDLRLAAKRWLQPDAAHRLLYRAENAS
ncbi:MAG: pitrilysin family protein [Propionibacteriaceae bacterium]|nr:pitrilysin family protein [Propionibacteriaceae bacterium]